MDYRHTEDFARRIEAAAFRAQALREEAIAEFWRWLGAALRRAANALWKRLARRGGAVLPEA